jgi:general secretion pathway protein F
MPVFEYKGLSEAGKAVSGLLEADSPKTLRALLRKSGVYLTDVIGEAEAKKGGASAALKRDVSLTKLAGGRISTDDIAITTRQLATLLGAGVTLVEALTALVDQAEKDKLKRVLSDVKQRVNEGSSLADALGPHQKIFGNLYINMIRAGEHSGALDAVLLRLADFTEGQAKLKQKVLGTLLYPGIMCVIGGGILTLLMTVVVPKVTKIFSDIKVALPWYTQLLIFLSDTMQAYWWLILPAIGLIVFAFIRWVNSPTGRPAFDRLQLKTPVVGGMVRMLAISRFTRTLATLLKSGVPLLTAMDIVKNVVTNSVLSDVVDKARDSIREGESIAAPLKRSGQFPPLVFHMIAIGERSGQLEDMLLSVADAYETQVQVKIGSLTALLEPLIIVAMGAVIAFVAFSILMPILQLNANIH